MATIGIDFGTATSCVAILRDGRPEVVPNEYGNPCTASYVSWDSISKVVVGDSAKDTASTNPKATISSLKTILGRRYRDPFVQSFATSVQYPIVDRNGLPHVRLDYKSNDDDVTLVSIESAASRLFAEFKRAAELHLRSPVKGAVVAVPVYFGTAQREALKRAAEAAGLKVIRLTHEPSAILTAYALERGPSAEPSTNLAVVDFGAGSLQVTVATVEEGVVETRSVLGSSEIGGDIIDLRLLANLIDKFQRQTGVDVRRDPPALRRLRTAAERAKRQLSQNPTYEINIDELSQGYNFVTTVTRRSLENLCQNLFVSISEMLDKSLKNAKLLPSAIDEVLLVGGSAKMPKVVELVTAFFKKAPVALENSAELVALGTSLLSVPAEESPLAPAGVITLEVQDSSLGVEVIGGNFLPIARRNSVLPLKQTRTFTSTNDDQNRFIVRIYEGESTIARKNNLLASFEVGGLSTPPQTPVASHHSSIRGGSSSSEGLHKIDVTVEVDVNHHVKVYATHTASNRNIGFELSDDVLLYDWSKQFVDGNPGPLKAVEDDVPWSPARWRQNVPPVSRSTAPTPPPRINTPGPNTFNLNPPNGDVERVNLERYAHRMRDISVQLGDASHRALDFARTQTPRPPPPVNGGGMGGPAVNGNTPPSRAASPSVYHNELMKLRELCSLR